MMLKQIKIVVFPKLAVQRFEVALTEKSLMSLTRSEENVSVLAWTPTECNS